MKKFRRTTIYLLFATILFIGGCETSSKDNNSNILPLLLLASSADYGTIAFNDGSSIVSLEATSPWRTTDYYGPTFYLFSLSASGRAVIIVLPIATMGVVGPYTEDSPNFMFNYNNGVTSYNDQTGHSFTFTITEVDGNYVRGSFSGELSNGATNITITDGTFNLAYE